MPALFNSRVAFRISSTCVPLSMASRIFCDPDSAPIQAVSHPARCNCAAVGVRQQIRARQALEGHVYAARGHEFGKLGQPAGLQPEDVVGDPQVIGRVPVLEVFDLVDDMCR